MTLLVFGCVAAHFALAALVAALADSGYTTTDALWHIKIETNCERGRQAA